MFQPLPTSLREFSVSLGSQNQFRTENVCLQSAAYKREGRRHGDEELLLWLGWNTAQQ